MQQIRKCGSSCIERRAVPRAQVDEMNESTGEMEETSARQINRGLHSIENNLTF
jgi:hypothetical protein